MIVEVNEIGRRYVTWAVFFFGIGKTLPDFHSEGTLVSKIEALNIDASGDQRV
jgi:hypothetical protein